jgi:glutathione synthase/RimK-type ligase-like ATP-grasp enzyme
MEDNGQWGQSLAQAARARGWATNIFSSTTSQRPDTSVDVVFIRVNQGTQRMVVEKQLVKQLSKAGLRMVIDPVQTDLYEDKLAQSLIYREFMPTTFVLLHKREAQTKVGELGYPFLSKSRTGSASKNVRLIRNEQEAHNEIERSFGSKGIVAGHRLGEGTQRNYLIWQRFLPGNTYDYRVCKIGSARMILRRGNRDDLPFASGSGKTEPIIDLDRETRQVLSFSDVFFAHTGTTWCGIDVVKDHTDGCWKMLETTIGWSQKAYAECTFFGSRRKGAEMWELVCDELAIGVFG